MRAIIIEDELNVREGFIKLLKAFCPEISVVGIADTVESGLQIIKESDFDLLFLDINLPDGSGFDLIHRLSEREFHLIFVTAYNQYALDAFKISAVDYLLKPVSPDLLINAIKKVQSYHSIQDTDQQLETLKEKTLTRPSQESKIILKDLESMHLIQIKDIMYCIADGSYTCFYLTDGRTITTSLNLRQYDDTLRPYQFIRPHHSYLVNIHHVKSLKKSEGSALIMSNHAQLPVSFRKKSQIIETMKKAFIS